MERPADEMNPEQASSTDPTVEELKAEISQTQGELQQTLAEIQERLSPSHIAEQARNSVRDATIGRVAHMADRAGETAGRMAEQTRNATRSLPQPLRENPLPVAMIGLGVAWLIARTRAQRRDAEWRINEWSDAPGYGGEAAHGPESAYGGYPGAGSVGVGAAAGGEYGDAGWSASGAAATRRIGDAARRSAGTVSRTAAHTRQRLSRTLDDNPMMLGAVALAAGALIGTMLPGTQIEDSYLGETRDNVLDSARDMAHSAVEQISSTGEQGQGRGAEAGPNR